MMIRQITPYDLEGLLSLYSHMHDIDDPAPEIDRAKEVWNEIVKDPKVHYFVIEFEKQLISSCHLVTVPNLSRGCRPYGLIENVVTRTEFRKQGFGKSILQHSLNFAWNHGCYKVMLLTGRMNESVFRFYESVGFSREGKQAFIARP